MQFEGLAFKFDDSDFEVDSNGGDVALCVCVVSELKEKAWLANIRVADLKEFKQIVIFWVDSRHVGKVRAGLGGHCIMLHTTIHRLTFG